MTRPLVIAHRGASGYLPENTLAAKAVAHAQGADFWETDVVVSRDGHLVVSHDLHLDEISDVHSKFRGRARSDGHHYVIDFDLRELRTLCLTERSSTECPITENVYPNRFPPNKSRFQMHTLAEEIELLQGLNHSFAREVGLYVELKAPRFHEEAGFDLCFEALKMVKRYGYINRSSPFILETFDAAALERIRRDVLPCLSMDLRLGQLVGWEQWQTSGAPLAETISQDNQGSYKMLTPDGLQKIASYADGIGAAISLLYNETLQSVAWPEPAAWISEAKALGLYLHAYTLRRDALPAFAADVDAMHDWLLNIAKVDGIFTDFPDLSVTYLRHRLQPGV